MEVIVLVIALRGVFGERLGLTSLLVALVLLLVLALVGVEASDFTLELDTELVLVPITGVRLDIGVFFTADPLALGVRLSAFFAEDLGVVSLVAEPVATLLAPGLSPVLVLTFKFLLELAGVLGIDGVDDDVFVLIPPILLGGGDIIPAAFEFAFALLEVLALLETTPTLFLLLRCFC